MLKLPLSLVTIYLFSFLSERAIADPLLAEKVKAIQHFVKTERVKVTSLSELEIAVGPDTRIRLKPVEFGKGVIEILKNESLVREISFPDNFPLNVNQIASDFSHSRFALVVQELGLRSNLRVYSVDGSSVDCPEIPFSPYARLAFLDDDFYLFSPADKKIDSYRYRVTGNICEVKRLESIFSEDSQKFRVIKWEDELHLFLKRIGKDAESYLEWIKLSHKGSQKSTRTYLNFDPLLKLDDYFSGPSLGKAGALFPLLDKKTDRRTTSLYLLGHDGKIRLIEKSGLAGWWVGENEILVHRGLHAFSSELVIMRLAEKRDKRKFTLFPSFQKSVIFDGGKLSFLEYEPSRPVFRVSVDVKNGKEDSRIPLVSVPGVERLPIAHEVEYRSEKGLIPGVLVIPRELNGCEKNGMKAPAVVYVHGGNFETQADGFSNIGNNSEILALAQTGYVIFAANYYSNLFLGEKYPKSGNRTMTDERARPQLEGLVAAGKYLQSLPCVDSSKVIYYGHSYGSNLGGILFTDAQYKNATPFRAAILKSGCYTEDCHKVFYFPNNPPAAKEASKGLRGRCFKKVPDPDCKECRNRGEMIHVPKTGVEIDNASERDSCEKFLDALTAIRRVKNAHIDTAIFLINSTNDNANKTQRFESQLKKYHRQIQSWYPENADHVFPPEAEVELIQRVKLFINGLK
jgi:hypothetical protein